MTEKGIYIVTGDADDMEGWTAESLAAALEEPLQEIGVAVEVRPNDSGGGGLVCLVDSYDEADYLRAMVRQVVGEVVVSGG